MTDTSKLWPARTDHSIWHWGAVAAALGVKAPYPRPFLIGIRGVVLGEPQSHETRSVAKYDDAFCLMASGKMHRLFPGATHAMQLRSGASPDVNHDGAGDVATIDPGRYVLTWKMDDRAGCPVFELTNPDGSKEIACHRDVDHDGIAETPGQKATAVLFHTGPFGRPPNAEHSSSIACQVTDLPSLVMMKAAGHALDYVLTTADEVARIVGELPSWDEIAPSAPRGIV
jgi:hypothetical protein